MHRAVIFDLFGTLVDQVEHFYGGVAAVLGLSDADLSERWRAGSHARNLGHQTFEASLVCLCHDVRPGLDESVARIAVRRGLEELASSLGTVSPTTLFVLQRLSDARVPTGLVSNAWPEVLDFWPQSPVARYFAHPIFSCAVGLAKPDPAIYQLAFEPLGLHAEECLFVGDGGDEELEGAAALGMTPVQVTHRLAPIAPARFHLDSLVDVLGLLDLGDDQLEPHR